MDCQKVINIFSSAIIDLTDNSAIAQNTKIEMHKNIFGNEENDPRLLGVLNY